MKKKEWFTLIIVVIIVAVIASFATIKLTGNVIEGSYTVRANSCDADTICEVAKTISTRTGSTSALTLTSDVKKVIVEGSLLATNLAGNGSAYVCVDKTGNLYRSSISCKS